MIALEDYVRTFFSFNLSTGSQTSAHVIAQGADPAGGNLDSVILENADEIIDQMILINAEQELNNNNKGCVVNNGSKN